ncbi:metal-sulfur cluster assembly factor [Daejeonella sp.]|uniref:metal-sulfur cluster assembly factor n=1 Tax=Daejeonella sp. TaxID=2805397 RepID=UPI00398312A8
MSSGEFVRREVMSKGKVAGVLRQVIDPELGINIVDMGLLYGIDIDDELKKIRVEITLSSAGCPMGAAIVGAVENMLDSHFPDSSKNVELVWQPAWSPDYISRAGRQQLEE